MTDAGLVGPELAHLSHIYLDSPRALVFRRPSSEWDAWVLLLPIASRLSLLANPIFGQLTRAWGFNLRFIGIDRERQVYDFRSLLADDLLRQLIAVLGRHQDARRQDTRSLEQTGHDALDVLFEGLARDMLTVLDKRRSDWGRHLEVRHRLEGEQRDSLFPRDTRYPDFLQGLRQALRDELIDVHLYGRILRSVDAREAAIEQRLAGFIDNCLDEVTLVKLGKSGAGRHLGAYNWLRLSPRHAANRAHVLRSLPSFARFFAETLVPLEALSQDHELSEAAGLFAAEPDDAQIQDAVLGRETRPQAPPLDLQRQASRQDTVHSQFWAQALRAAVDAGQDREVLHAIAHRFNVPDNVVRRLWRDKPDALGALPTWQLSQVLHELARLQEREWPRDEQGWHRVVEAASL